MIMSIIIMIMSIAMIRVARYGLDRAEEAVLLPVDACREVERVGVAAKAAVSEPQRPQAGIEDGLTCRIGKGAEKLAGRGIEGIDGAVVEGEVADQQVAAELAEGGRRQGDAPRRGQWAAGNQLTDEVAVGVEYCYRTLSRRGPGLGRVPGGSVGHV